MIVVHKDGRIEYLNQTNEIEVDLFDKLMGQPQAFAAFLKQHWTDACSALFVFQIQPIDSSFHCSVIHIVPAVHGKGNSEIVSQHFKLKDTLQKRFTLDACGLAFDGDSCFNAICRDFYRTWIQQMRGDMPSFPLLISDPGHPLVSSDSLHLLREFVIVGSPVIFKWGWDKNESFVPPTESERWDFYHQSSFSNLKRVRCTILSQFSSFAL
jgi:hypothetical protein